MRFFSQTINCAQFVHIFHTEERRWYYVGLVRLRTEASFRQGTDIERERTLRLHKQVAVMKTAATDSPRRNYCSVNNNDCAIIANHSVYSSQYYLRIAHKLLL